MAATTFSDQAETDQADQAETNKIRQNEKMCLYIFLFLHLVNFLQNFNKIGVKNKLL
jgi:hypothetical protein